MGEYIDRHSYIKNLIHTIRNVKVMSRIISTLLSCLRTSAFKSLSDQSHFTLRGLTRTDITLDNPLSYRNDCTFLMIYFCSIHFIH